MKTTPNLSLPYPELTDTADVPRDVQALADKLDALLGGGGGGGGGSGTLPLAAAPVLDVGMVGQVRAGRQLSSADFTSLGLSAPIGLWSLSDLTNQGSDGRPLVNLGAVPFGAGINGTASTCAVFAGSTGQALYIADSGAADPYRIKTGSVGCWFRTAKLALQEMMSKATSGLPADVTFQFYSDGNGVASFLVSNGTAQVSAVGVSNVSDDRWHFSVGTCDGTTMRLYVDGVLESTSASGGIIAPTAAAPLNIGGRGADASTANGVPHYGRVDEAFITADVLTEDQIRLLYAAKLQHTLGTIPTGVRLKVHRRRKGAALAVADFATQPVRLHNFTGGALTDQGSGGVALTNNGAAVAVAGADGTPQGAFNFGGGQSLSATDTGLPGGLTARSYGCWFKTTQAASAAMVSWTGAGTTSEALWVNGSNGAIGARNLGDDIFGPFVSDGQWHFAVVAEDNSAGDGVKRKLYLDGRLVGGSTVLNALTLAGANRFRIGAWADASIPFIGQIDAAFITNYALTATDIRSLYAKGAQDLGGSPKNAGDHVERVDAATVLMIADTLDSQHTLDLGVVA